MLYAAYGSNLDPSQMASRCPHSPQRSTGWAVGWRITFGGEGWDGALPTLAEEPGGQVFVALYDVTAGDENTLDQWESATTGLYRKVRVRIATLDGEVTLKIPSETQSGRVFRLRDKGVKPVRGGARGDLFCKVVVETPVNLSSEQKELIRKLEETLKREPKRHAPREDGFFEGVKRFFSSGAK